MTTWPTTERIIHVQHVSQLETGLNNCGEACLSMVLNTWLANTGKSERIDVLDVILAVGNNGRYASLNDLKRAALTFGLALHIRAQQTLDALVSEINAGRPVIALVHRLKLKPTFNGFQGSHFVVACGYTSDHIVIHDPLSGVGGAGDGWRVPTVDFKAAWATTPGNSGMYQAVFAEPSQWRVPEPPPPKPTRTALIVLKEIRDLLTELETLSN